MLNYWHQNAEEKFDFNSGSEKIEVEEATPIANEFIHFLPTVESTLGSNVLIASVFTRDHSKGTNLVELIESIRQKVGNDAELMVKLNTIIFHTLADSFEASLQTKF